MINYHPQSRESELLAELDRLRQEVEELTQRNNDLDNALLTAVEHGDIIEAELYKSNQILQREIAERKLAQATLQSILETVSRDKRDLEIILSTTAEHGDFVEYQLYTQAVDAMHQNEQLLMAISDATSVLLVLARQATGQVTYANSIAHERLAMDEHSLIGCYLHEIFANTKDYATLTDLFATQFLIHNYELEIVPIHQPAFWATVSAHPLTLRGEDLVLITLYDISQRKATEEALRYSQTQLQQQAQELEQRVEARTAELRQAEKKYRSIVENSAEGIFQATVDGQYLSVNPAMVSMYGYASATDMIEMVTDIGRQLYVQPSRWDEMSVYLKRFGSVSGFESEVYRQDGSKIWVSENIHAVHDDENVTLYYEGSVRDITELKTTEEELRKQRLMSERLLLNVLPQSISQRLKRGEKNIADHFVEATVLFADIAGFTNLSSHISPIELIDLLNDIFSAFDHLVTQHKVEKIKTIGDAYMIVSGVPSPRADHVSAIADIAIDMQDTMKQFHDQEGKPIQLRIGIHTGPVVAGIIGTSKFIYDLWGDTVNIASRMESQGEPGRIQVTQRVFERLNKRYRFEARGEIDIKGKGPMVTYWLDNRIVR